MSETSLPPKEYILQLVRKEKTQTIASEFSECGDYQNLVEWKDERSYGDGNERYATIHFKQYDLYVSLIGMYSSHGSSTWDECFVSRPYVHREVRYEAVEEKGE